MLTENKDGDDLKVLFSQTPQTFRNYCAEQGLSPNMLEVHELGRRRVGLNLEVPLWEDYEAHKKFVDRLCSGNSDEYKKCINYLINALNI